MFLLLNYAWNSLDSFFFPNEVTMRNSLPILENNGSDKKDAQNLQYPINAAEPHSKKKLER